MAFLDTYSQLTQESQFKRLPFVQQQQLVSDLLGKSLSEDPEVQALDPTSRANLSQQLYTTYVQQHKPSLYGFQGQLTDQDRSFLDQYYNQKGLSVVPSGADPNINYKMALYLGEKLDQGDPLAADKAKTWIASNRIINESLIAKVAAGAKDALEQMFGTDDKAFNDLAFHSTDYSNLAEMLTSKMSKTKQSETKELASLTGGLTAFAENIVLTNVLGGAGPGSGVFLKPVWNSLETKALMSATATGKTFFARTAPRMVSSVAQGVVDVLRSAPQLIERGNIQGPKAFWEGTASTFGQGMAFDLFANLLGDATKIAFSPIKKVFGKSLEVNNVEQVKKLATMLDQATDPRTAETLVNSIMNGSIPKELFDQMDGDTQKLLLDRIAKGTTLVRNFNPNPRTPDGFRVFAKAMGYDVDFVQAGIEATAADGTKQTFKNLMEAASFMQDNLPKSLGNLTDDVGGILKQKITVTTRTNLTAADLSPETLKSGLYHTIEAGTYNPVQAKQYLEAIVEQTKPPVKVVREVSEQDFLKMWTSGRMPTDAMVLPSTVSSKTVAESVSTYVNGIVGDLTGPVAFQDSSVQAIRAAVKRLDPNAFVAVDDAGYHVTVGGQAMDFRRFEDLNAEVWNTLHKAGQVSFEELQTLVKSNSGFSLVKSVDKATGQVQYALRGAKGRVVKDLATLDDLFSPDNSELFGTKLPETLKPAVSLGLDGGVYVSDVLTSGSPAEMFSYMKAFKYKDIAVGAEFERTLADGSKVAMKATDNGRYAIEIPDLGLSQEFETFAQAKQAFGKKASAGDALRTAVAKKGYILGAAPNGNLLLTDKEGKASIFKDGKKLRQFLASVPDDADFVDLLKYGQDVENPEVGLLVEATKGMKFNAKIEDLTAGIATEADKINATKLQTEWDVMIRPAMSYLRREAGRYGAPELASIVDAADVGKRAHFISKTNIDAFVDAITGDMDKDRLTLITHLMQVKDKSQWSTVAKQLLGDGFELSANDIAAVDKFKQLYRTMGKSAGDIDLLGFMENRISHYKPVTNAGDMLKVLQMSPAQRFATLFPGADASDRTLQFISRNMRLDDFVNQMNEQDISKITKMYADKIFRERYLQGVFEKLGEWANTNRGLKPDALVNAVDRFRMALVSMPDQTTVGQKSLSLKTSMFFSNLVRKSGEFFGDKTPLGKAVIEQSETLVTDDILGAANRNAMSAVMAFRPFSAYRNSLEAFSKGWPWYRQYFMQALDSADSEYIGGLYKRGLLSDRIFESGENAAANFMAKVKEFGMRPVQNSEIYSRALIAKSADLAFDDALQGLTGGLITTADQFRDVARLTILDDLEFKPVWDAIQAGQKATARDIAVKRALDTVMGNFSPENKPKLFTGYFGKLFGTFGVYSATTLDFYRRVASGVNIPLSDRLMTLARLGFASTALTNGFRALGIDYSGFALTDTLGFNGGPIWATLIDASRASGNSPEAAVSRKNLARNFSFYIPGTGGNAVKFNVPRLVMPGANQLNYMEKGIEDLLTGGAGGWQELIGAPALEGPFTWKWY